MTSIYITSFDFHVLSKLSLGERLKFFRQQLKQYEKNMDLYTIKAIAERLDLTPQAISAVERGLSKNPSFGLIYKLTKEYNVSMDTLTNEYYEGEEKLFSIGKPDVIEIDLEELGFEEEDIIDFEVIEDTQSKSSNKVNTGYRDEEKNNYALPTPSIGVLFYQYSNKQFNIVYKNAIKNGCTEKEFQKLLVRLDLDITLFNNTDTSIDDIPSILEKYEANRAINKSLNSKELLEFLTKNN